MTKFTLKPAISTTEPTRIPHKSLKEHESAQIKNKKKLFDIYLVQTGELTLICTN